MFVLTRLFAVACLPCLVVAGCSRSRDISQPRASQSNPNFHIDVTEGPEDEDYLADAILHIEGQVVSENGFHSHAPLLLQVRDLASGLWCSPTNILQNSSWDETVMFDPQTGAFEIGVESASQDLLLTEGEQEVYLIATDSEGQEAEWMVTVDVAATYTPTFAQTRAARGAYADQIDVIYSSYAAVLAELEFDESAFPWAAVDQQAAELMSTHILEILDDPTAGNWIPESHALENELSAILQGSGLEQEEPDFCASFMEAVGWWRWNLEMASTLYSGTLGPGRDNEWMDAYEPMRTGLLAFFEHTYADAGWSSGGNEYGQPTTIWEARIWQDDGAPHLLNLADYEPNSVDPNTGSAEDPAWSLRVVFTDTDSDGDIDTIAADGLSDDGHASNAAAPFSDSQHHGHPLTFLRYVFATRYIGIAGL